MSGKKTEILTIRLTDDEKKELMELADEKMTDVSTMMRQMAAKLCLAHREYGELLLWPPRFVHYEAPAQQAISAVGFTKSKSA